MSIEVLIGLVTSTYSIYSEMPDAFNLFKTLGLDTSYGFDTSSLLFLLSMIATFV